MNQNPSSGFLYKDLKEILQCAKTKFEFCLFSEACGILRKLDSAKASGKKLKLFMRHDVDVSLEKALTIAQIERDLGIRATYMVMTDSKLYGLDDGSSIGLLNTIMEMGHEIGLHIHMPESSDVNSVKKALVPACKRLEEKIDLPVSSFAFHRPGQAQTTNLLFRLPLEISGRVNAYATELTGFKYESEPPLKHYISDSGGGRGLTRPLLEMLRDYDKSLLQLLIHPIWWGLYPESGENLFAFYVEKIQNCREELRSKINDAINYDVNLCSPVWNRIS